MYIILCFSFSAAVYDPSVHSFYDEPLPYAERYHKYADFKEHKPTYRDGEFLKYFSFVFCKSLLTLCTDFGFIQS